MGQAFDQASTCGAENGDVFVDGPGNIAYCMTPDAAALTSDRMLASSAEAQGQRVEAKRQADEQLARRQPPVQP